MKASNWLYNYTRHTRTGDRTYKDGDIEITWTGLRLKSGIKHMDIIMTDSEISELNKMLTNLLQSKKKIK